MRDSEWDGVQGSPTYEQQVGLFPFKTGGLSVEADLLGASWYVERDDYPIVISLPSDQSDFAIARPGGKALFREVAWQDAKLLDVTIKVFQVAVWVESEATYKLFPPDHPEGTDGQEALNRAARTAVSVAEDFLSWLRVRAGQFWLGASHESLDNAGTADLVDLQAGRRIKNINWNYMQYLTLHGEPAGRRDLVS